MEQTVAEAVAAATQQQQAAQQAQQLINQPSPPVQPVQNVQTSAVDNLTCQWQGCGERCDSAESLYVSTLAIFYNLCDTCCTRVVAFPSASCGKSPLVACSPANTVTRTTSAKSTSVARAPTTSTSLANGALAVPPPSSVTTSLHISASTCP